MGLATISLENCKRRRSAGWSTARSKSFSNKSSKRLSARNTLDAIVGGLDFAAALAIVSARPAGGSETAGDVSGAIIASGSAV
jgi:hypothetical protein